MYTESFNTNSRARNALRTNKQQAAQLNTKQKLALGQKTNLKQQRWTTSQMEEISFAEVQTQQQHNAITAILSNNMV